MQRFRWIALQGSSRGFLPPLLLFYLITTSGIPAFAADVSAACSSPIARVVSIQGSIEVLRAGQNDWGTVTRLDTQLCDGDRLRTGALSRAALFIQPETLVRVDQNTNISVSQTAQETLIEFRQEEVLPAAASAYSCGAGYFITRFPRKFRVKTPHLNAAVEGTEFLVAMRCESTALSVFEGKVLAASTGANIFPAQSISSGQMLTIGGSEPPTVKLLVKPTDAVQWVLYYPPLSDAMAETDLPPAEQCRTLPKPLDQTCLTQRAEALLRLGRVDEAQREVDEAVALDPGSGDANALRAIISIARNDKAGAMEAATAATIASPNSYRAWLALSYAQQASFNLDASLVSARKAQALEPNSSVTNARVAELLMSLGRIKEAEKAARAVVDANPSESRAHTVLGFVRLAQIKTKEARADFLTAIERDSSDPLPRLGLGLAIIREGKLADGREQLEIAVALDPTNSLLRSYVGKAYYEENRKERDQLAAAQFDLSRQLDPNDPTPWFYDAILKQTQNRPVEALESNQRSVELNDNRATTRSRLLLDEDLASRSTNLARIYRELGFEQIALAEAYGSLALAPDDFSGHRLLADAFSGRPRHEIARVSEVLQSQLWQPLSVTPIDTPLFDDRSFVLSGAGPTTVGLSEFNPLFVQQGAQLLASGVVGGNSTRGDQILLSGIHQNVSASIGQFYYDTNGFQDGSGLTKDIKSAFLQAQLSADRSVFGEVRHSDQVQGDLSPNFFGITDSERLTQERELYRVGFRTPVGGWQFAGTLTKQDAQDSTESPVGSPFFSSDLSETATEVLALYGSSQFSLLLGGGTYRTTGTSEFFGLSSPTQGSAKNTYGYASHELLPNVLRLELGLSWEELDRPDFFSQTIDQVSPKFGVVFRPWPGTTLRGASFRTLRRSFISEQTIEPTQVAGFNQFFNDFLGTDAVRTGVALDQRLSPKTFIGAELSKRRLDVPQAFTDPLETFEWNERDYRGYFYYAPYRWLSTSVEYRYERITQNPQLALDFLEVTTQTVPVTLYFPLSASGVSLRTTAMYVHQMGQFRPDPFSPDFVPATSAFWVADFGLSYRLPRRRGQISAEVRNAFDRKFNYQETDVLKPTLARERLAFLRLGLSF